MAGGWAGHDVAAAAPARGRSAKHKVEGQVPSGSCLPFFTKRRFRFGRRKWGKRGQQRGDGTGVGSAGDGLQQGGAGLIGGETGLAASVVSPPRLQGQNETSINTSQATSYTEKGHTTRTVTFPPAATKDQDELSVRSGRSTGGAGVSRDPFALSSTTGGWNSVLAGALGTFRSSRGMSRHTSLEELTLPEGFVFRQQETGPVLPTALMPQVAHGLARIALNVRETEMTPATWEVCLSLLKPEDAARVRRYKFDKDRRLALGSALLQRALVHWTFGTTYTEIVVHRTDKGKPFIKTPADSPFENWNYNVSHHGDYVGIASEPLCLVGLDIMNAREKPRSRGTSDEFLRVFERQLSASEWGSIYEAPDEQGRLERFYKQWALKEAYIKAIGSGLTFSPRRIEITGLDHSERPNSEAPYDPALLRIDGAQRKNWRFKFYRLRCAHVACVCRGPPADAIASYKQTLKQQDVLDSPVLRSGLESIQPSFEEVTLRDLIPADRLAEFDATLESLIESPLVLDCL